MNDIITKDSIDKKIHLIRGLQVMLDSDLAKLYEVETRVLNQSVKRNIERFPINFMFQLSKEEHDNLMFQIGTSSLKSQNVISSLKSQNATSSWGGVRKLPFGFTEQGVAMLSGILRSNIAINVSIQIMEAFVSMRRFLSKNAELFNRLDNVERKQLEYKIKTNKNFEKVFDAIENNKIIRKQGIFYDGQIFDAYKFISDLIKTANKSIILIDNFIDDTTLTLFLKRKHNVKVIIYTKNLTKQLKLDLKKFNYQYDPIDIKEFKKSHDRFLLIDNKEVYHIGASLKDLGKKWFAFSRFDKEAFKIFEKLL